MTRPLVMQSDPLPSLVDQWLRERRTDLNDALSLCESPIEVLFLAALLCAGDEVRTHFHLEPPPYPTGRVATSKRGSLFAQHVIGTARVDFAIVGDRRIVVDLDGHEFHSSKEQRSADAARDRELGISGWTVLRFTGSEVYQNSAVCVATVLRSIDLEVSAPPPSALSDARSLSSHAKAFAECRSVADEDALMREYEARARARRGVQR